MKTITLKQARRRLDQIVDEVLNGKPVVLTRGRGRILMRACAKAGAEREWMDFCQAFPSTLAEPSGMKSRIRKMIKRIRRT